MCTRTLFLLSWMWTIPQLEGSLLPVPMTDQSECFPTTEDTARRCIIQSVCSVSLLSDSVAMVLMYSQAVMI